MGTGTGGMALPGGGRLQSPWHGKGSDTIAGAERDFLTPSKGRKSPRAANTALAPLPCPVLWTGREGGSGGCGAPVSTLRTRALSRAVTTGHQPPGPLRGYSSAPGPLSPGLLLAKLQEPPWATAPRTPGSSQNRPWGAPATWGSCGQAPFWGSLRGATLTSLSCPWRDCCSRSVFKKHLLCALPERQQS